MSGASERGPRLSAEVANLQRPYRAGFNDVGANESYPTQSVQEPRLLDAAAMLTTPLLPDDYLR